VAPCFSFQSHNSPPQSFHSEGARKQVTAWLPCKFQAGAREVWKGMELSRFRLPQSAGQKEEVGLWSAPP
jgi:hypothetical protein